MCCLLLPHSTYFIRQFLVLVLFVGDCFCEIMCIWDSCVYQKVFFVFLFIKVISGLLKPILFPRKYSAIPVQLEIFILLYIGWCVFIIWTLFVNQSSIIIIIIIIVIIIIIIVSFIQGIYTYIPETNYVPREYSVATILLLLFMVIISLVPVLNLLYFYKSTFRSMCAVPNMAVSGVP